MNTKKTAMATDNIQSFVSGAMGLTIFIALWAETTRSFFWGIILGWASIFIVGVIALYLSNDNT